MNVLRDTAILDLQRNNVEVIEEQLRQTRDRFNVGEVTRTDVAQAKARLAAAQSQASLAEPICAPGRRLPPGDRREATQLAPGRPLDGSCPAPSMPPSISACASIRRFSRPCMRSTSPSCRSRSRKASCFRPSGLPAAPTQRFDVTAPGDERFTASAGRA